MSTICVIIPCYNEANRLPVETFLAYQHQHPEVSFCFVNDGSTDATSDVLQRMNRQNPRQNEVLILPQNLGKAGAVRAGMQQMSSRSVDYLGYFDADLATPLPAINDLQRELDQHPNCEMVMGSRMKYLGTDIRRSTVRHYTGRIVATFISNILSLPVYDTQCGAKLFRRGAVGRLFADEFISPWLFDVELLARLIRQHGRADILNGRVAEVPLRQWVEQRDSRIQPTYYFKLWWELFRINQIYRNPKP
ncbi:MAG: glycosyltransferase family 2 protein [Bacteroidetes bacterium]|nr:glycosyltransferase family 2 protein [Fibrella sp.]